MGGVLVDMEDASEPQGHKYVPLFNSVVRRAAG
jgi:hypothetical protein